MRGRVLGQSRDQLARIGVSTDDTDAAFAVRLAEHMPPMGSTERHLRLRSTVAVVVFYALGYTDPPEHEPVDVEDTAGRLATVSAGILAAEPTPSPNRSG